MREKLIAYVRSLFRNAADTPRNRDLEEEILQNTLDRYDDLIAEGKAPEAAYRLSIMGIGDLSEILGSRTAAQVPVSDAPFTQPETEEMDNRKRRNRAIAIGLYIVCMIPLIALSELGMDILGLCITLLIVAGATYLLLTNQEKEPTSHSPAELAAAGADGELKKSIRNVIGALGLVVYLILTFTTRAWYITWLMFPLIGAFQGLANAILDLKEASKHEK